VKRSLFALVLTALLRPLQFGLTRGGLQVLAARGPRLILELPGACFLPEHEPYVSAIFRHILEDPVTLQAAMEAEIRNTLSARGQQADNREGT